MHRKPPKHFKPLINFRGQQSFRQRMYSVLFNMLSSSLVPPRVAITVQIRARRSHVSMLESTRWAPAREAKPCGRGY